MERDAHVCGDLPHTLPPPTFMGEGMAEHTTPNRYGGGSMDNARLSSVSVLPRGCVSSPLELFL